jgi:hypothetical protein
MAWYVTKPNQYTRQAPAGAIERTCAFSVVMLPSTVMNLGGESLYTKRQGHTNPAIERDTQETLAP